MNKNLVQLERHDGEWCVVFYPFVGCHPEQSMLLSRHGKIGLNNSKLFAERYRDQFIATLNDHRS